MFGVGSLAAAIGVKRYLESTGRSGTVVYYGTPGEEGGSGKAFMAREGSFDGPGRGGGLASLDQNAVMTGRSPGQCAGGLSLYRHCRPRRRSALTSGAAHWMPSS